MRRAVITGLGAVSTIGIEPGDIESSLRQGKSGISFCPEFEEHGFKSQVAGWIREWTPGDFLPRKALKFMGRGATFSSSAALQALADSGLAEKDVQSERCGVIVGCGEGSSGDMFEGAYAIEKHNKPRRMGIRVPRTMSSTHSANITMQLKNRGMSLAISDACATGLVNIGYAAQAVKWGLQDVVFAGGAESCDWCGSSFFDAMGVLPAGFNDRPEAASRPFDRDRQGFVIAEGAGIVVVEERERALARGAKIYGEIVGYATNCDGGTSMVAPSSEGQVRCMTAALGNGGVEAKEIEYVNTHGTSTEAGDPSEIAALREVFGDGAPMVTSTKSQIGHSIGAAGALEIILSLIMMKGSFVAPSINIDNMDEACSHPGIVTAAREIAFDTFLTNNFAFGGSNASMIVKKHLP